MSLRHGRPDRGRGCQDRHRVAARQSARHAGAARQHHGPPDAGQFALGRGLRFRSRSHPLAGAEQRAGPAIANGLRRMAEFDGRRVPVWDFNDIDVSAADPATKLYFSVQVAGVACRANVWVHGADARTLMPQPFQAEAELPVTAAARQPRSMRASRSCGHTAARRSVKRCWRTSAPTCSRTARAHACRRRSLVRLAAGRLAGASQQQRRRRTGGARRFAYRGERRRPLGFQRYRHQRRPPTHQQAAFLGRGRWGADLLQFLDARACARTYLPNPEPPLGNCA